MSNLAASFIAGGCYMRLKTLLVMGDTKVVRKQKPKTLQELTLKAHNLFDFS